MQASYFAIEFQAFSLYVRTHEDGKASIEFRDIKQPSYYLQFDSRIQMAIWLKAISEAFAIAQQANNP